MDSGSAAASYAEQQRGVLRPAVRVSDLSYVVRSSQREELSTVLECSTEVGGGGGGVGRLSLPLSEVLLLRTLLLCTGRGRIQCHYMMKSNTI